MSVYADIQWRGQLWCHMQADSLDELHAFAASIGLKPEWFQPGRSEINHHYDVNESKRTLAISRGAIPQPPREWRDRRAALRSKP